MSQLAESLDLGRKKKWADVKWKVTFEPTKCKSMMLSRKRKPSNLNLHFGDCKLSVNAELEILGVI